MSADETVAVVQATHVPDGIVAKAKAATDIQGRWSDRDRSAGRQAGTVSVFIRVELGSTAGALSGAKPKLVGMFTGE
jgi:hypothetical protein